MTTKIDRLYDFDIVIIFIKLVSNFSHSTIYNLLMHDVMNMSCVLCLYKKIYYWSDRYEV